MDKSQEDCIRECIQEIDTIKRRLVGLLSNQKVDVFEKPTFLECSAYFRNHKDSQSGSEGHKFFDYYESNGWKVGKNKMKCWKSAANQWIARNKKREEDKRSSASDRHDQATKRFLGV